MKKFVMPTEVAPPMRELHFWNVTVSLELMEKSADYRFEAFSLQGRKVCSFHLKQFASDYQAKLGRHSFVYILWNLR